jgi:anti-sigma regulatory factor (Ser/Thr protein kinase)
VEGLDGLVATAAYQPEPTAAAAARRFVRDTLQTWLVSGDTATGHGLVDDAVLLTSELVTNAVVHAGTPVEVTCKLTGGGVEVVVSDGHPAKLVPEPPENEHIPAERTSGRGLLLPAALASAWGVTYGQSAKAVWFRIGEPEVLGAGLGPAGRPSGEQAGFHVPPRLEGQAKLAGLRPAAARNGAYRWPVPPFGEPGYDELLATTVESARAAVGADAAYAMVPDEDGELRLRAAAGSFPSLEAGPGRAAAAPARPAGLEGQAKRTRGAQPGRRPGRVGQGRRPGPAARAAMAGMGAPSLAALRAAAGVVPSLLTVPFVVDGRVTGLLAAASATAGKFRDDEATRLQQLADRWGPTLERERLSELERVRRGRIAALAQARGLLAGGAKADEILALAAEAAVPRLVPWSAVLLPAEGNGLRTVHARHIDEKQEPALAWLLDRVSATAAAAGPPARVVRPARTGPMWSWSMGVPVHTRAPRGAAVLAAETAWCFPLGAGGDSGVLAVGHRRDERLPTEVAELAADLACRIGVALDNARLMSQQH